MLTRYFSATLTNYRERSIIANSMALNGIP